MPLDQPFKKSEKTVKFIGEDGQVLNVVSDITPAALRILKKQGYKKASQRDREQEENAENKDAQLTVGGDTGTGDKESSEEPDESWSRDAINQWASDNLDPPLDVTEAKNKADALKMIEDALADSE